MRSRSLEERIFQFLRNFTAPFTDQLDKLAFLLVLKIAASASVMWIYDVGEAGALRKRLSHVGAG